MVTTRREDTNRLKNAALASNLPGKGRREAGCEKGRIGLELNQVSQSVFDELRRQLPMVEWVDAWDIRDAPCSSLRRNRASPDQERLNVISGKMCTDSVVVSSVRIEMDAKEAFAAPQLCRRFCILRPTAAGSHEKGDSLSDSGPLSDSSTATPEAPAVQRMPPGS